MFRMGFLKIFFVGNFLFSANFQNFFQIFQIFHIEKKWRRPLLYHLFTKAVHISTLVEPNQMKLGFVITNDKASYVAKEDSIHLFCVAKETALNEQQIKSCVLLLFCLFQQSYTMFVLGKLSGGEGTAVQLVFNPFSQLVP